MRCFLLLVINYTNDIDQWVMGIFPLKTVVGNQAPLDTTQPIFSMKIYKILEKGFG